MNNQDDEIKRPNPDELLASFEKENQKATRGHLKIFLGASAGVGKTYSMLLTAKALLMSGKNILIGVLETHGRKDTAELVKGFEVIPLKKFVWQNREIPEFDLDITLKKHPDIVLIDELAHSNVPGVRHLKRWQDIEELLEAGIDVFTTLNIQHLESLNHIITGITGINVFETIPDHVFDNADEVVLVDLPPDDLLKRLKEGKIYLPEQTEVAIQNFFRKGNLIALRELALRRTAERVDKEMRDFRGNTIQNVSYASDSLLVCIGPYDDAEEIVRNGSRLATQFNTSWHVIYVETLKLRNLEEGMQQQLLKTLKLARDLGAITTTLTAIQLPKAIIEYARKHNLTKIVLGRTQKRKFLNFHSNLTLALARLAPDMNIITVASLMKHRVKSISSAISHISEEDPKLLAYIISSIMSAITVLIATPLLTVFGLANIVLIFLIPVVIVAYFYGKNPAVFSAIINVIAFDFFFIEPRFTFTITDIKDLLTFVIMLLVGLLVVELTSSLKYQTHLSLQKEIIAQDLYQLSQALSAALTVHHVIEISDRFIKTNFQLRSSFLIPDDNEELNLITNTSNELAVDMAVAQWVFIHGQPAGFGTDTLPGTSLLYLPLKTQLHARGVFVIEPNQPLFMSAPDICRQIETFISLTAIALERIHFVSMAQQILVQIEAQKLNQRQGV